MDIIEPAKPVLVVDNNQDCGEPQVKAVDGIPVFPDDLSLARWAIEHPGLLKTHHRDVLADCRSTPVVRAHFEGEGVDLTSLGALIRSTSNQTAR